MIPSDGTLSNESIAKIDELVNRVQALADPTARALAVDLVQAVMNLHAAAFDQVLKIVGSSAPETVQTLAADDIVSRVLVLHGLHPDNFDVRIARAIDKLQRYFDSRGGGIEVLEAGPDLVRIRFTGNRPGSGSAARNVIENVIYEAAPEVGELVLEGVEEQHEAAGFVPLESLLAGHV